MSTTRRPLFAWIYTACWLPYFVLILNFVEPETDISERLTTAAASVLPLAVFGLVVIRLSRRRAWTGERRGAFFAAHAGGAFAYASLSALGVLGLYGLIQWWRLGQVEASLFRAQNVVLTTFMGLVFYTALAGISQTLEVLKRLRKEEARTARAETQRALAEAQRALAEAHQAQAELRALRAQLNPHFLFNTLHTLLALVRRDARAAEEALEQFGGLLHYSLGSHQDGRDDVPFAEEWDFVRNYLARLEPERFWRVHRSHIVNLDHVAQMRPFDDRRLLLVLGDGSEVLASRSGSQRLRQLIS